MPARRAKHWWCTDLQRAARRTQTEPQRCGELQFWSAACVWRVERDCAALLLSPGARASIAKLGCCGSQQTQQLCHLSHSLGQIIMPYAAIHGAASLGKAEQLRQLLEQGVSPDLRTEEGSTFALPPFGQTPLHCLCQGDEGVGDRPACFVLLREAGANLEAPDRLGYMPLHMAARVARSLLPMLVEAGVNVNVKSLFGLTPLHTAAKYCPKRTVIALIRAGAAVNAQDITGTMPLEIAIGSYNLRVCPILLRAGATIPPGHGSVSPYFRRVIDVGGFKKYEQAHLARITAILAPTPGLPPEMVRKIVEYWLHAGCY